MSEKLMIEAKTAERAAHFALAQIGEMPLESNPKPALMPSKSV